MESVDQPFDWASLDEKPVKKKKKPVSDKPQFNTDDVYSAFKKNALDEMKKEAEKKRLAELEEKQRQAEAAAEKARAEARAKAEEARRKEEEARMLEEEHRKAEQERRREEKKAAKRKLDEAERKYAAACQRKDTVYQSIRQTADDFNAATKEQKQVLADIKQAQQEMRKLNARLDALAKQRDKCNSVRVAKKEIYDKQMAEADEAKTHVEQADAYRKKMKAIWEAMPDE